MKLQWGVKISLPGVFEEIEPYVLRAAAILEVAGINRRYRSDVATLVYRTFVAGPWQTDLTQPGNEWGMQITWPHGHMEVRPTSTRFDAESQTAAYRGAGQAHVVCRQATYGDWQPFADDEQEAH